MKTYKRLILILILAALLLPAASNSDLITLTLINKSGKDIAFQMYEVKEEIFYYLPVEEGTREAPTEKTYTISRGYYQTYLFYIETWDPVYGYDCTQNKAKMMTITGNQRIVFLPCQQMPPNLGEPRMLKYWPWTWYKNILIQPY